MIGQDSEAPRTRPPASEATPTQEEDEQQFAQRLSALHEVSLQLSLAPTHDDLCRLAVELGRSRLGFERLGIWFVDPTDRAYMIGTFGIDETGRLRDERSQRLLIAPGAVRHILLTGNEPLQYSEDDVLMDDRSQSVGRGAKAAAALWDGQEIIGHISTDNLFSRRPITPRQRDLLVLFARTVGHLSTLKRREEALRRANQELQERNEDLNAFAHMVAHDLQNPLALMIGYAEALSLRWPALSEDEARRNLRQIIYSGQRMSNIIEELLVLAEARRQDITLRELDMAPIVHEAIQRLEYLREPLNGQIVASERWPRAYGHAPWVEEVWVNYISNALKYGGRPPIVHLGADLPGDQMARFWVRDNGAGLSAAEQARLFEPFSRLDQGHAQGHGLGLSIVRRIVAKMGGQVGVESQEGQGSLFYFTLPLCHAAAPSDS
jgi:signal transduction histidine kinase